MSFNKPQAKIIVKAIEKKHHGCFRLAACVPVKGDQSKLDHFPAAVADVRHQNISEVFHTFRRRHPHGQYLLIVVAGENVPASPPDTQTIRQRIAKIRRTFKPVEFAPILKLDTNWLDKAFEYQKRLTY